MNKFKAIFPNGKKQKNPCLGPFLCIFPIFIFIPSQNVSNDESPPSTDCNDKMGKANIWIEFSCLLD
jgi:hypothetical protein